METNETNEFENKLFSEGHDTEHENVVVIEAKRRRRHHRASSHKSSGSHRSSHKGFFRSSRKKKSGRGKFKLDKTTVKKYLPIVIVILLIGLIVGVVSYYETSIGSLRGININDPSEQQVVLDGKFAIQPIGFDGEVDVISDVAKICAFLDSNATFDAVVANYYRDYKTRFDTTVPLKFKYELINAPDSVKKSGYTLILSENEDYSDALVYKFTNGEEIKADNLKTNTKYYYTVRFDSSDYGYSGTFKTSDTPRILSVDGIGNVRDIGNWKTKDGKRIKQGLLYRGTELDGMVEAGYKLTEKGKNTMLNVLGIRYEMDLRSSDANPVGVNMLGDSVEHKYYNCLMYKSIFSDLGKEVVKEIFTDLADPENYPIYMHCTYGLDRTGTVSYLLEAMLGLSDEDLKREYELSALFHLYTNIGMYDTMIFSLEVYEGETTQEKVINYLLDCGVTEEQMDSIRNIFIAE